VTGWSEVSGVISFTDNPRQISLDRHAAYVNVLLKADPDSAPKLLPELERRLQAVADLQTIDRETTPVLIAIQTRGDVLSPDNIRRLCAYVQRIQADARVARVDSIVSADPRFTIDQYELLYTHPQLIADPYLSELVQTTVAGNTMEMLVISKYGMLDQRLCSSLSKIA